MSRNYIDFISAYCDNWCERCAFTERCSHFAVASAMAMCDGDADAAIELAVGAARLPDESAQQKRDEQMGELLDGYEEPTERELAAIARETDERDERLRRHVLAETSRDYVVAGRRWFAQSGGRAGADAATRSAVEIIHRDLFLIHVKIMRALSGRDEDPAGHHWSGRVQNDWNGSAKVALISIERSERAWRDIAAALQDEAAGVLGESLARLRHQVSTDFPRAMEFRRPGFD